MSEGLTQTHWTFQDSRCHLLTIDLTQRELRPVMDDEAFPLNSGHPQTKAIEQGAVACGPGGYNMVLYAHGVQDQPQHALVVDSEIWTTGLPGGGFGVLVTPEGVICQKNVIRVHVWKPDGSVIEIARVNSGHDDEVVAFTPRGGTNEYPKYRGKHFYSLDPQDHGRMVVVKVAEFPPKVWGKDTVLEATYDLGLNAGDIVKWKQNLGADNVTDIMSGSHLIVRDGQNIVDEYEMDPEESHGPDNWFVRRNPRTAIGCSEDGKTAYMLCVEGRLPNQYRPDAAKSKGLRLKALAETAVKHGVWAMVNMDGGGSAFQWVLDGTPVYGCYNQSETIAGQRRAHFSAAVM